MQFKREISPLGNLLLPRIVVENRMVVGKTAMVMILYNFVIKYRDFPKLRKRFLYDIYVRAYLRMRLSK